MDLSLHASLPYRSTTSIPESSVFGAWTAAVVEQADVAFTDVEERNGRIVAVRGGQGDLELRAQCNPDGVFSLSAVAITDFRLVRVPRVWDRPERRAAEADSQGELSPLARTFKEAFDEWTKSISALARWARSSPPPPGAKRCSPGSTISRRTMMRAALLPDAEFAVFQATDARTPSVHGWASILLD